MIKRLGYGLIVNKLQEGKVVLLYGPRRVGKTTLLKQLNDEFKSKEKIKFVNGESRIIQDELSVKTIEGLKTFVGDATILIIDEAQSVPDIGMTLKMIVDNIKGIKIIASGSASFSLSNKVGEPLTGRKKTVRLFPISVKEIIDTWSIEFYKEFFENHIIFGGYPDLFSIKDKEDKIEYLHELVDSYLYKDILELEYLKNSKKIKDLLILLAFQIGKEVSLSELASNLSLHTETVHRYLDLLEKVFVVVNIRGFSRNLGKEVTKTSRYYFYDNGIRNALINNFNPLKLRNDVGQLWENFIVMERIKKQTYYGIYSNNYFWRTYDKKEIDWVEERGGKLFGYEIKFQPRRIKMPKLWKDTYPNASFEVISKDNFFDFVC